MYMYIHLYACLHIYHNPPFRLWWLILVQLASLRWRTPMRTKQLFAVANWPRHCSFNCQSVSVKVVFNILEEGQLSLAGSRYWREISAWGRDGNFPYKRTLHWGSLWSDSEWTKPGASAAMSLERLSPTCEVKSSNPVFQHLIIRGKSWSTLCRKSWIFSGFSGFLPQGSWRGGLG